MFYPYSLGFPWSPNACFPLRHLLLTWEPQSSQLLPSSLWLLAQTLGKLNHVYTPVKNRFANSASLRSHFTYYFGTGFSEIIASRSSLKTVALYANRHRTERDIRLHLERWQYSVCFVCLHQWSKRAFLLIKLFPVDKKVFYSYAQ